MDGYKYLSQISKLRKKIDALRTRRRMYEELANSIPGGNYDEPVVQKTRDNKAPFIKWIDKIIDVDNKIAEFEKELKDLINSSIRMIGKIENEDYQNILMMRFINEMMWEDIASELAVSYSTCKRWYYFALTEFEKLNGDERL